MSTRSTGKRRYIRRTKRENGVPFYRETQDNERFIRRWYIRIDGRELGYNKYIMGLNGIDTTKFRSMYRYDYDFRYPPTIDDLIICTPSEALVMIKKKYLSDYQSIYSVLGALTRTIKRCQQESH